MDGSSVLWMYHSHVDEVRDINTGLIGPMIVTARDQARPDGSPKDVDREIVTAFAQVEENLSWLADGNLQISPEVNQIPRDRPSPMSDRLLDLPPIEAACPPVRWFPQASPTSGSYLSSRCSRPRRPSAA